MKKKIAVLSDTSGSPTTLPSAETIIVYERGEIEWQEISGFSLLSYAADTPNDLRLLCEAISDVLGDVKVILGSDISGASFFALNRVGFLLCESEGISDAFFDELFRELDADKAVMSIEKSKTGNDPVSGESKKPITGPQPGALPGYYFISLKDVQQCNPLLSTKKILLPFLKETPFQELVILCDHTPPWFETYLTRSGLSMVSRKADRSTIMLTVTHAVCE